MANAKFPKFILSITFLMLLIILSTSAFAITFNQETSGQWTKFGFDRFSSNGFTYPLSIFSMELEENSNFTYSDSVVSGGDYQPIVYDWDSDGTVEILSFETTNVNVYTADTNTFVSEYSNSISGTVAHIPYCFEWSDDADLNVADNDKFCVYSIGNNVYTSYYENDQIYTYSSATITAGYTQATAWSCHVDDNDYTQPYCFATAYRNSDSQAYLLQYSAMEDTLTEITLTNKQRLDLGNAEDVKIVISDIDYDGILELVYAIEDTSDDLRFEVQEWNATDNSISYSYSVDFGTNNAIGFGGLTVYDLDSTTDQETCFSWERSTDKYVRMSCYNGDGTLFDEVVPSNDFSDIAGHIILADTDNDNVQEIVFFWYDSSAGYMKANTYEGSSGSLVLKQSFSMTGVTSSSTIPTASLVNSDDYYDIIYGNKVLYYNSGGVVSSMETKNIDGKHSVPVNFNKDAQMDLMSQSLNNLYLYTEGTGGLPTTSTITLNTVLDDSGFYNYYPTVCKDTTQTFKALECVSGSFDTTCTYVNTDTDDTERIVTYGDGGSLLNGTYSTANPEVNVTFDTAGVFNVRLYMQEPSTTSYYGVYDDITITVVDGTAGSDCNVPTELITQPSSQEDISTPATVDSVENFFEIFSYGSSTMKFVFGLIIILGMCVMAYGTFQSVVMTIIFGVAGLILATILGLIPLWVIIGLVVLTALPLLLKLAFGNNG